tara:strand:+ start:1320 stop:1514 length:195 start_codon:yes stop_codon:yes gene_type:complete
MIKYTHWFAPNICFGLYAEKSIILKTRKGLLGLLFGNTKILTETGYTGWHDYDNEMYEIPEDYK